MLQHYLIDTLFLQKKIGLSLSHLVPEILGPKVGLVFHKNVLFNRFKTFCINFLIEFWSNWRPFSLILNLLSPYFHKTLDPIRTKKIGSQNLMKNPARYGPTPCWGSYNDNCDERPLPWVHWPTMRDHFCSKKALHVYTFVPLRTDQLSYKTIFCGHMGLFLIAVLWTVIFSTV